MFIYCILSKLKIDISPLLEELERVLKNENHQNLTPEIMSNSGPALEVWSHRGSNLYPKMAQ